MKPEIFLTGYLLFSRTGCLQSKNSQGRLNSIGKIFLDHLKTIPKSFISFLLHFIQFLCVSLDYGKYFHGDSSNITAITEG